MSSAYQIIAKKRDGLELTDSEIKWMIEGMLKKQVADYQMSAFLMAIYLNGFSVSETAALTDAMLYSGSVLHFNTDHVIDKHSTGGVGDKASFILAPLAHACGVKVPMIAGRGLGHTGGTIDKIESIKGFKTSLTLEKFKATVEGMGIALIGQTGEIAPADKKIYALRDVTATIESIPLITASIMSKKLAEGAQGIVMDIKVGSGAFMKTKAQARELAKSIRETGKRFGKNMLTTLTDMNQPLGNAVGNSLEIIEAIDTLKGKGPKDLTDLSLHLAGAMIYLAGLSKTHTDGIKKAKKALKSGAALQSFRELIENQGGDPKVIDDYSSLPSAQNVTVVTAPKSGYMKKINNTNIGLHCVSLGGGRAKADDKIDFGVGFIFHKKLGEKFKTGDPLVSIHHNPNQQEVVKKIEHDLIHKDITFALTKPENVSPLIIETQCAWAQKGKK